MQFAEELPFKGFDFLLQSSLLRLLRGRHITQPLYCSSQCFGALLLRLLHHHQALYLPRLIRDYPQQQVAMTVPYVGHQPSPVYARDCHLPRQLMEGTVVYLHDLLGTL